MALPGNIFTNNDQVGITAIPCGIGPCNYIASHARRLVVHITHKHGSDRGLHEACYVQGCKYRFGSGRALRCHMRRYHHDWWNKPVPFTSEERCQEIQVEDAEETIFVDEIQPQASSSELFQSFQDYVRKASLRFRLSLEHEYGNPACTVKDMHEDFQTFLLGYKDHYHTVISKRLEEVGVVDKELSYLLRGRTLETAARTTKAQATKFFKKSGYVEPVCVTLLPCEDTEALLEENDNAHLVTVDPAEEAFDPAVNDEPPNTAQLLRAGEQVRVSNTMHYVPILETLKQYLSHDDVVDSIFSEEGTDDYLLKKFKCGFLFQNHPLFQSNPRALRIILYLDECEVVNPLGGARGIHKILGVYFSVGNIEQYLLSSLDSIHLALLCEERTAIKYTHRQVLRPLIKDLNQLWQEGITVRTRKGYTHHWVGAVAFITGDNKTQHTIAGFRGTFSQGRVCRFCMADYSQLSTLHSEEVCVLRTPEVHALHLRYVSEDQSQIPLYGVTGPSSFSGLDGGVVNEMFAPDILHDAMEGVLTMHLYQLIRALHTNEVVLLPLVIQLIASFPYGRNDKRNKPRAISPKLFQKNYSIVGSASRRWTLFSVFPLAVGPHVPEENVHWKLFLLAQQICDIIFAPVVEREWLTTLIELVEDHHAMWVQLYPGVAVFKWHVLVHYARLIYFLGPLRHAWTMRFESFHQFFIRTAKKLKNYKCITKTLSVRCQRRACVRMNKVNILPPKFKGIGAQSSRNLAELPLHVAEVLKAMIYRGPADTEVCEVKSVTCQGLQCSIGDFVIIKVNADGAPTFLKIEFIFLESDDVILIGPAAYVLQWSDHFHAYAVQVSHAKADFFGVTVKQVVSPQTLDGYCINGRTYLKLKFSPAYEQKE